MPDASYSLDDLADAVGIEARTIRSYIERGLLPGALTAVAQPAIHRNICPDSRS